MIFILHYLLLNAGLPATVILLTLFLQTYSDASMTEIGSLLMALPFVSIFIKPLFCALADRHQAHKLYLILALVLMFIGYGSLTIAPFFPAFVEQHGRLVWYLDVLGVIVGYGAFGVIWSLGDALAVNHAQMNGLTWGTYRVWGVVSWGGGGILIGQINETPLLPKYVPAMFVLMTALLCEIVLLLLWPNKHFVMSGSYEEEAAAAAAASAAELHKEHLGQLEDNWSSANRSLTGTLTGSARADPRMIGAVANMFMEDLGGTLRSSLKLGGQAKQKRGALDDILGQHRAKALEAGVLAGAIGAGGGGGGPGSGPGSGSLRRLPRPLDLDGDSIGGPSLNGQADTNSTLQQTPTSSHNTSSNKMSTFGRGTLRRAQMALARMNSLSAASGHVIADELTFDVMSHTSASNHNDSMGQPGLSTPELAGRAQGRAQRQPVMYMSSLASQASLGKAAAARALGMPPTSGAGSTKESPLTLVSLAAPDEKQAAAAAAAAERDDSHKKAANGSGEQAGAQGQLRSPDELQLILLKLIVRRDKSIWKYLVIFTILGGLLSCHLAYFFIHLERLCVQKGADFSYVLGGMMAAHSVSEVFSFTIAVPYFVPLVGRTGALLASTLIYVTRFFYYAFFLEQASPYTGIPFELAHGIAYGIIYSLVTDIACECVNQVDRYIPELIQRGLMDASLSPGHLKLQLRATMQGLFSGAFDGLGNGLGALIGGLVLDAHPFTYLWSLCTYVGIVTAGLYSLVERRSLCGFSSSSSSSSSSSAAAASKPAQEPAGAGADDVRIVKKEKS